MVDFDMDLDFGLGMMDFRVGMVEFGREIMEFFEPTRVLTRWLRVH